MDTLPEGLCKYTECACPKDEGKLFLFGHSEKPVVGSFHRAGPYDLRISKVTMDRDGNGKWTAVVEDRADPIREFKKVLDKKIRENLAKYGAQKSKNDGRPYATPSSKNKEGTGAAYPRGGSGSKRTESREFVSSGLRAGSDQFEFASPHSSENKQNAYATPSSKNKEGNGAAYPRGGSKRTESREFVSSGLRAGSDQFENKQNAYASPNSKNQEGGRGMPYTHGGSDEFTWGAPAQNKTGGAKESRPAGPVEDRNSGFSYKRNDSGRSKNQRSSEEKQGRGGKTAGNAFPNADSAPSNCLWSPSSCDPRDNARSSPQERPVGSMIPNPVRRSKDVGGAPLLYDDGFGLAKKQKAPKGDDISLYASPTGANVEGGMPRYAPRESEKPIVVEKKEPEKRVDDAEKKNSALLELQKEAEFEVQSITGSIAESAVSFKRPQGDSIYGSVSSRYGGGGNFEATSDVFVKRDSGYAAPNPSKNREGPAGNNEKTNGNRRQENHPSRASGAGNRKVRNSEESSFWTFGRWFNCVDCDGASSMSGYKIENPKNGGESPDSGYGQQAPRQRVPNNNEGEYARPSQKNSEGGRKNDGYAPSDNTLAKRKNDGDNDSRDFTENATRDPYEDIPYDYSNNHYNPELSHHDGRPSRATTGVNEGRPSRNQSGRNSYSSPDANINQQGGRPNNSSRKGDSRTSRLPGRADMNEQRTFMPVSWNCCDGDRSASSADRRSNETPAEYQARKAKDILKSGDRRQSESPSKYDSPNGYGRDYQLSTVREEDDDWSIYGGGYDFSKHDPQYDFDYDAPRIQFYNPVVPESRMHKDVTYPNKYEDAYSVNSNRLEPPKSKGMKEATEFEPVTPVGKETLRKYGFAVSESAVSEASVQLSAPKSKPATISKRSEIDPNEPDFDYNNNKTNMIFDPRTSKQVRGSESENSPSNGKTSKRISGIPRTNSMKETNEFPPVEPMDRETLRRLGYDTQSSVDDNESGHFDVTQPNQVTKNQQAASESGRSYEPDYDHNHNKTNSVFDPHAVRDSRRGTVQNPSERPTSLGSRQDGGNSDCGVCKDSKKGRDWQECVISVDERELPRQSDSSREDAVCGVLDMFCQGDNKTAKKQKTKGDFWSFFGFNCKASKTASKASSVFSGLSDRSYGFRAPEDGYFPGTKTDNVRESQKPIYRVNDKFDSQVRNTKFGDDEVPELYRGDTKNNLEKAIAKFEKHEHEPRVAEVARISQRSSQNSPRNSKQSTESPYFGTEPARPSHVSGIPASPVSGTRDEELKKTPTGNFSRLDTLGSFSYE